MSSGTIDEAEEHDASYWRRLLHRWLVQYNPLYLLSAMLCLAGMVLCSRGLAHDASLRGEVGVAAIAELYALALIGGAALLTRIGQRRPAVLLALITALYQCDLTLHTEACVYLGAVGVAASIGWCLLFVVKLYALAWALRLRVSLATAALATGGALGVTLLPYLLAHTSQRAATELVSLWLFGLFGVGLHAVGTRGVTSVVPLDAWGQLVLRRALHAVWSLWSLLLVGHVAFWSLHTALDLASLWPVPVLLGTYWLRRESQVWAVVATTLSLVGLRTPGDLTTVALLVSAALAARALWRREAIPRTIEQQRVRLPYRAFESDEPVLETVSGPPTFVRASLGARKRLLTGALFALYLAVWTHDWTGGAWPEHLVALDAVLTVVVVAALVRARLRIALVPLALSYVHFAIQANVITAPQSALAWGASSVGAGFVLLLGSLAASYWLRDVPADQTPSTRTSGK